MTDCSMIKLKHGDLCMLHASDYLYPLIEDPYMMVSKSADLPRNIAV